MLNRTDTELFITTIAGNISEPQTFFAHHRDKGNRDISGPLDIVYDDLLKLNQSGFSIFMVINKLNGPRKTENVEKVRAVFFDDDDNQELKLPLEPSLLVQSKGGQHGYYLVDDNFPLDKFTLLQTAIAKELNTDPAVKDLPRLMRVPGFAHTKDLADPREVKILKATKKQYSYNELISVFNVQTSITVPVVVESSEIISLDSKEYIKYANMLPIEEGSANKYGGRNKTALLLVRQGFANNHTEATIEEQLELYCDRSGLPFNEVKQMISQQAIIHAKTPFSSYLDKKKPNFDLLTEKILQELNLYEPETKSLLLKYWRGEFYFWKKNKYTQITKDELATIITAENLKVPLLRSLFRKNWIEEILQNLRGKGHLPTTVEAGDNLKAESNDRGLIFLNNCILKLNEKGEFEQLPISHDYFNLYSLPFNYEPTATAPTFEKFLAEVVLDEETRNFIQEWFGYNLAYNNSYEKFVVFVGTGANGKSVLLTVLMTLLGAENVSSVPLESFDAKRTFPLACTIGKLANICDEIGNTRGAEEILKKYVSGSAIYVEKKGKDGSEHRPTARLTFATNKLPSFNDPSNGIWRRLIVIEMKNQILDENKQDIRLKNPDFWVNSCEMSGILNWALLGYKRLQARGYFAEPQVSKIAKTIYSDDVNPFSDFFEKYLQVSENGKVGATDLYGEYSRYAFDAKMPIENKIGFNAAMKKQFPTAVRGENANIYNSKRQRIWQGIEWVPQNNPDNITGRF